MYTVKPGDSLYSIAKEFNVNMTNIKEANTIKNDLLSIGQTLKIPLLKLYTVQAGDTLSEIAYKFGTTVDIIKSNNNLINDKLYINQILKI